MIAQTFPRSCAFAAVGGLLSARGVPAGDRDVCRWAQIPWTWGREGDTFVTGSGLADDPHLNVATQRHGWSLVGRQVDRDDALAALREAPETLMLGVRGAETPGHAVIVRRAGRGWDVENIGRAGEPDGWHDTDASLTARLRERVAFAWLDRGRHAPAVDVDAARCATQDDIVPALREALLGFWARPRPLVEVNARREGLLAGLILEGPGLMGVAGEEALATDLARLQLTLVEALRAAKAGDGIVDLPGCYPLPRLRRLLERYAAAMGRGFVD